jgi:hypothetical protein
MLRYFLLLPTLISCWFLAACHLQSQPIVTQTIVTSTPSTVITTPVPADKEIVLVPKGYANRTWVPVHTVCQYPHRYRHKWVAGHWYCRVYNLQNMCRSWGWINAHWS